MILFTTRECSEKRKFTRIYRVFRSCFVLFQMNINILSRYTLSYTMAGSETLMNIIDECVDNSKFSVELNINDTEPMDIENVFIGSNHLSDITKPIISHNSYFNNPSIMDKYKIADLRNVLKHYKGGIQFTKFVKGYTTADAKLLRNRTKEMYDFALVGTKQKLIDRVVRFFKQIQSVICIQKHVRGSFVRTANLLRGPALRNRSLCVNETDFYTLEPVTDIPCGQFFSYNGNGNFVYGFELDSILKYIQNRSRKVNNPYTRELMDPVLPSIQKLVRLTKIFAQSGQMIAETNNIMDKPKVRPAQNIPARRQTPTLRHAIHNNNVIANVISLVTGEGIPSIRQNTAPSINSAPDYNINQMIDRVREMRIKPFPDRAQSLFMEIDLLGHYTQSIWFTQLNRTEYIRYFRCLRDIWMYRAQLSLDIKMKICPLWDPFVAITSDQLNFSELNETQLRNICISIMEDMVFTGIDGEFRMLGAFHVLSALTIVSLPARHSMMWLYESLVY